MIVKDKFILLKDVQNTHSLSATKVRSVSIEKGPRKIFTVLEMTKGKINHFTKKRVIDLISDIQERKIIHVVNLPDYNLAISYNAPTDGFIINVNALGTDDIYPNNPDPKNTYASMVYGIIFRELVKGNVKVSKSYFAPITNYLLSLFMKLFGKEFGLLGIYSTAIPKLKFMIGCYVLGAFYGITRENAYKQAATISAFDYKDLKPILDKIDFTSIDSFIKGLSDVEVMPGMNKYTFTARVLKLLGVNFLPGLEDFSRFISIIATSNISGSNVVPTFISKYNESEYNKILELPKIIFKRRHIK